MSLASSRPVGNPKPAIGLRRIEHGAAARSCLFCKQMLAKYCAAQHINPVFDATFFVTSASGLF
jgi:hypothetical protein